MGGEVRGGEGEVRGGERRGRCGEEEVRGGGGEGRGRQCTRWAWEWSMSSYGNRVARSCQRWWRGGHLYFILLPITKVGLPGSVSNVSHAIDILYTSPLHVHVEWNVPS